MTSSRTGARRVRGTLAWIGLAVAVAQVPEPGAGAQVPPSQAAVPAPRPRRPHPRAPPEAAPTLPQPDVKLTLEAPTPRGPWTMRIANDASVPVRVVADARFLAFELIRRGDTRVERCELPSDMRPAEASDRSLVLPPGRAYVETFEPRLYCFSGKALNALEPTSIVVAHLGWLGKGAGEWEVSPIDGVDPQIASQKHLDAPPVFLYDEKFSFGQGAPAQDRNASLALQGPESVEAESPDEVGVPVTLRNTGSRAVLVRFRPDTVGFEVFSPSGRELCAWPRRPAAPTPELFTRIRPGGTTQMTFAMAAFCNDDSLDRDGLLVVRPWLDTRGASGKSIGLDAFTGWVSAATPTFVRLHRGRGLPTRVTPQVAPP
jgi:hypothetical protein